MALQCEASSEVSIPPDSTCFLLSKLINSQLVLTLELLADVDYVMQR